MAVGLMMFQQLSGINVVMFYTVSIFQSAGLKESGSLATVGMGIVQVRGYMNMLKSFKDYRHHYANNIEEAFTQA